jgi:hypothetical protein
MSSAQEPLLSGDTSVGVLDGTQRVCVRGFTTPEMLAMLQPVLGPTLAYIEGHAAECSTSVTDNLTMQSALLAAAAASARASRRPCQTMTRVGPRGAMTTRLKGKKKNRCRPPSTTRSSASF